VHRQGHPRGPRHPGRFPGLGRRLAGQQGHRPVAGVLADRGPDGQGHVAQHQGWGDLHRLGRRRHPGGHHHHQPLRSPSCGPRRRLPSRRCMPTRSRSTALTAARVWALSCWTGLAPKRRTRVPTGCGWTCGRPMSTSSTTTCAKASPTSALSSCPTILQGRCSSGQHSASPRPTCRRSRA
jgi:hypothetical protein